MKTVGDAGVDDGPHAEGAADERLVRRGASTQAHPPKLPTPSKESLPIVFKAMARAVAVSIATPAMAVRFALGLPVGLVASMVACAVLTALIPLTAPMAFFLTLSLTSATGILFVRGFPLKDVFDSQERMALERAKALYEMRAEALDRRAGQLREGGMTNREIAEKLEGEQQRALEDYQAELVRIAKANPRIERAVTDDMASKGLPGAPEKD
jgi:hypothetical protein